MTERTHCTFLATTLMLALSLAASAKAQMFDPAQLRPYQPKVKIQGAIRVYGSELKGQVVEWEKGFVKFHPDAVFANNFSSSSEGSIAGLYILGVDLAPAGDDAKITDQMPFYNIKRYMPTEISVATGGYEKRGTLWAIQIVVNKDNPLTKLSLRQLDQIFGAERTGGWDGIFYTGKYARGADQNIRTWGQLDLKGEWASKPIQTYGYVAPGFEIAFERKIFHWSDKWNENYKEYVEAKEIVPGKEGDTVASERMFEALSKDKYGIAWGPILHSKDYPNLKQIDLSAEDGGTAVPLTEPNVQNRTYPFIRDAYMYIDRVPGKPVDDRAAEFMSYILSREGQQDVKAFGIYNPLPQSVIDEQRKKLE